jgi:hypothetical protein
MFSKKCVVKFCDPKLKIDPHQLEIMRPPLVASISLTHCTIRSADPQKQKTEKKKNSTPYQLPSTYSDPVTYKSTMESS